MAWLELVAGDVDGEVATVPDVFGEFSCNDPKLIALSICCAATHASLPSSVLGESFPLPESVDGIVFVVVFAAAVVVLVAVEEVEADGAVFAGGRALNVA